MKPLRIVSEDEFWSNERQFRDAHSAKEGHLPSDVQAANYDRFYDLLVTHLKSIGSHAEGSGEADFNTSRFVDPSFVTTVVSETSTVLTSGALDAALRAIAETGGQHLVIFDTGSYIAVLPDASVIGYSEFEELI